MNDAMKLTLKEVAAENLGSTFNYGGARFDAEQARRQLDAEDKARGPLKPFSRGDLFIILLVGGLYWGVKFVNANKDRIFQFLWDWILAPMGGWAAILGGVAVIAIGFALYGFKVVNQLWYGRLEMAFSVVAGALAMEQYQSRKSSWAIAFAGAVYVFVRGVGNVNDAKAKAREAKREAGQKAGALIMAQQAKAKEAMEKESTNQPTKGA
jgi:hypothetical protein